MSRLRLTGIATPATPAAGKMEVFERLADKRLCTIDDAGLVRAMLEEVSTLYRLIRVTNIFQGTTSYTPTAGADALYVEAVAGGGAGGGVATAATNSGAAGGGGGGAYSTLWTTVIKAFTVQIGAGGTPGAAGANPGGAGTDSTFDSPSICTAKGGLGGLTDTVAAGPRIGPLGGAGGAAASGVGDVKAAGCPGGAAIILAAAQALSGRGGLGFPAAGGGIEVKAQGAGVAGGLYGAGGSGGCILSGGASVAGGAGGNGLIRVWEFQSIT